MKTFGIISLIVSMKFFVLIALWFLATPAVNFAEMALAPFGSHLGKLAIVLVVVPIAFNFIEQRLLARSGESQGSEKNWMQLLGRDSRCECLEECEIFQGDEDSIF